MQRKNSKRGLGKELLGTVVSNRMNKTIVVEVTRLPMHPMLKKRMTRYKNFKAHDEKNDAKIGDLVRLREIRPMSKGKCWRLVNVVKKAT